MVFNKDPAQRFLEPPRRGKPPGSAFRWRQARNLPQRVCPVSASPPACVPLSTPPCLSAWQRFAGWQICLVGKSMPCHGGNAFPSHMRRGKRPTLHGRRKFGDKPNGHCVNGRKAGWLCKNKQRPFTALLSHLHGATRYRPVVCTQPTAGGCLLMKMRWLEYAGGKGSGDKF